MSDNEHIAKAHQEIATRNSQSAIRSVDDLRLEVNERLDRIEALVAQVYTETKQLEAKYNLLLTKNFNRGSTTE